MNEIIEAIRVRRGCYVRAATEVPTVSPYTLPRDVIDFYTACGGIELFGDQDYGITIVPPEDFVKANPVIAGVDDTGDRSDDWFIVAKSGEQFVTIDLNPKRIGRCYDSFWDRHGVVGSCPVIARSFTELVERLVASSGRGWFWLQPTFRGYGDAYDELADPHQ